MSKKYIYMLLFLFLFTLSTCFYSNRYGKIENVRYVYNSNDLKCKFTISNITEKNEKFEVLVYYPVTENKKLNKKINDSICMYIESFKENLNDKLNKLLIKFDNIESRDYTSFIFNVSIQNKSTNTENYVFAYNIDNNGKIIEIDELLNKGFDLNSIKNEIIDYLSNNEIIKKYGNFNDIKNYFDENKEKYSNFYFTKNEIVFYFNPGNIMPNVAGIIYVPINYTYFE